MAQTTRSNSLSASEIRRLGEHDLGDLLEADPGDAWRRQVEFREPLFPRLGKLLPEFRP